MTTRNDTAMEVFSVSVRLLLLTLALSLGSVQPAQAQVRLVQDLRPGPESSAPAWMTPFDGRLFFWADDGTHGRELWATDGDVTTLVADIFPGPAGAQHWPTIPPFLDTLAGKLYFRHRRSPTSGDLDFRLWATDGESTALVADILPGYYLDPARSHAVFQDKLYLGAYEPDHGTELWATDGDSTALVADIFPFDAQPGGSFPSQFTPVGDTLYFFANNDEFSATLWATDGDTTKQVAGVRAAFPGPDLVAFANMLYFQGEGELWRSDGTRAERVADIWPGPAPSRVQHLFVALGRVFFITRRAHCFRQLSLLGVFCPSPRKGIFQDYSARAASMDTPANSWMTSSRLIASGCLPNS